MNPLQKRIVRMFCCVIVAVNVWGALPSIYKAPYGRVGSENVLVYEPVYEPMDGEAPTVPIRKMNPADNGRPFLDTGKKVQVFLRNDYRDQPARTLPRVTLLFALVGLIFYRWAGGKRSGAAA